jgi:hypothetical protein
MLGLSSHALSASFTLPAPLAHPSHSGDLFSEHVSFSAGTSLAADQSSATEFCSPVFQGLCPVILSDEAASSDTTPLSHYSQPGVTAVSPLSSSTSIDVNNLPDSTDDYYRNFTNYENSVLNLLDSIMTSMANEGECKPHFESSNGFDSNPSSCLLPQVTSCIPELNVKLESNVVFSYTDFINVCENAQQASQTGTNHSTSSPVIELISNGQIDSNDIKRQNDARTSASSVSELQQQINARTMWSRKRLLK